MARIFTDAGGQTLASANQTLFMVDNFSVAFWFYRTATPGATADLITTGDAISAGWFIQLLGSNVVRGAFGGATANKVRDSSSTPTLNGWTHVIVTHTNRGTASTDFLFYFNGKEEAGTNNSALSGAHTNTIRPLIIGQNALLGNRSPPAHFGQTAIWNRAVSPAEALALAGGAHPIRFKEGLLEIFDLSTAHGEEGWINKTYLVQGATNPSSAAVNPPVEASTVWGRESLNVRPFTRSRARYLGSGVATAVLGGSIVSATTEADIVTGGKTITLTLTNTTWVP